MDSEAIGMAAPPPHSISIEQAVISGLMADNGQHEVIGKISEDDFYSPRHALMFRAISSLASSGKPADALTVLEWLTAHSLSERTGGEGYLVELLRESPATTANLDAYARHLRELATRRRMIGIAESIRAMAHDRTRETPDILSESDSLLANLMSGQIASTSRIFTGKQLMVKLLDDMERALENPGISGISTGIRKLDDMTDGLQKSTSVVIAAPPSMGKTTFAMNLVATALKQVRFPIVVFSAEMPALDIIRRMASGISGFDYLDYKRGTLLHDGGYAVGMERATLALGHEKLIICDDGSLTPAIMRAILRGVKKRHGGVSMACVDYIQLLDANKALPNNRNQELTAISRDIKRMAMDFELPFLVISQLTKDVEKQKRKPTNGDLRESGAIAQDADLIMMVHRQEKYDDNPVIENIGKAEIIITKNRNGACGSAQCGYKGSTFQFYDTEVSHGHS